MMMTNPNKHRRSIRLRNYDYTEAGAYFVTIVTQDRECLFGEVMDGVMQLHDAGCMVRTVWNELPTHYAGVEGDAFIVMPNHIHAIVLLAGGRQPRGVAPTADYTALSFPNVVHRFKTLTTKRYIDGVKQLFWKEFSGRLWQRNYFEHVIRNEESLNRIRQYILDNPARWGESDRENPFATQPESADAWR